MMYRFIFCLCLALSLTEIYSQKASFQDLVDCVEKQYGADNLLVNGRPYYPSNTRAEGHPYFDSRAWKQGNVFIKGHAFEVANLKYDLLNQHLIINHVQKDGMGQSIILSDLLVDSFYIGSNTFLNKRFIPSASINSTGYLEKIYTGKSSFFRIQKKVFGSVSNFRPYGQFSDLKDEFVLIKDDKVMLITKRKTLLSVFPDHKKKIKKFMKKQGMKWKNMDKNQFIQLLKFCDDQV